jgi:hypothetical protein
MELIAVSCLNHFNREVVSRVKEEMMQQNLQTFALP